MTVPVRVTIEGVIATRVRAYAKHYGVSIEQAVRSLIGSGWAMDPLPKKKLPVETTILGPAKDGEVRG